MLLPVSNYAPPLTHRRRPLPNKVSGSGSPHLSHYSILILVLNFSLSCSSPSSPSSFSSPLHARSFVTCCSRGSTFAAQGFQGHKLALPAISCAAHTVTRPTGIAIAPLACEFQPIAPGWGCHRRGRSVPRGLLRRACVGVTARPCARALMTENMTELSRCWTFPRLEECPGWVMTNPS